MYSYIENPKEYTKTLLELINEFSKVAAYKIWCISTNQSLTMQKWNQEKNPFIVVWKWSKYLGINLTKKVQDWLYIENYKILLKEIVKDLNEWKDILYSWNGRFSIVRMAIYLQSNL